MRVIVRTLLLGVSSIGTAAIAQMPLDQANTAIIQRDSAPPLPSQTDKRIQIDADLPAVASIEAAPSAGIFIGAIRVSGATVIPVSAFSAAIEPFIGRTLTNADLASVTRAVADVARARGYRFASAFVGAQSLSLGVLTITLDEGAITQVRVIGTNNKQLQKLLAPLAGKPRHYDEIERQLLLIADTPGLTLQRIQYVREGRSAYLTVTVNEDTFNGRAGFDTLGTRSIGPVRAVGGVNFASTVISGDQISLQAASTPIDPNELAFVALRYASPIDVGGTVVAASVALGRSQPGGFLEQFDTVGHSQNYGLSVSHPLIRSRKTSVALSSGFDYLVSRQRLTGFGVREDRIATAWFALGGNTQFWGGLLRSDLTITQGLDILGATQRGAVESSRPDAPSQFTKASLSAEWTRTLFAPLSVRLAAINQFSIRPLLAEQELGIGGPRFGRGYGYSERSGDKGALGSFELRSDFNNLAKWLNWVQPYAFFDGGKVINLANGIGDGTLTSGGGGVRARLGEIDLGVEAAFPINADRFDSNNRAPRFNLQLSTRF